MTKDTIKKAFADAEKDQQEEEIKKIKQIVQRHLEEIERLTKNKKNIEDEIKVHREILDDLKAGRLDKIEEYLEKDDYARQISLIIVKKVEREYIPMYPWRSPWIVEWRVQPPEYSSYTSNAIGSTTTTSSMFTLSSGTSVANFSGGTYTVSSGDTTRTINL